MSWKNQSGGPCGGGPRGPWGSGQQPGGPGRGGGNPPPDLEDLIRRGQDKLKSVLPGSGNFSVEADDPVRVAWWGTRDGYVVDGHTVVAASPTAVTLETDGVRTTYDVTLSASAVDVDHPGGHRRLVPVPRFVDPADAVASGSLLAPMPGTVVKVAVEAGQQVRAGEVVLVLEAMKMQHTVTAPTAGTVTEINVQPGAQVAAGEVLAVVDAPAEGDPA